MDLQELRACLLLHSVPGLTNRKLGGLLRAFGGPRSVLAASQEQWRERGLLPEQATALALARQQGGHPACLVPVAQQLDVLLAADAIAIDLTDPRYPALLSSIYDPPAILYARGNIQLLQAPMLAMVGSRRASPAGLRVATELAAGAVAAGLGICSGLAMGIDGAAHRGALAAGGDTVAVMATGIEQLYPRRHRTLGEEIGARGCLVSEFPPGSPPLPQHFPRRNRVISGLSLATVVVEAAFPSGSLLTAGSAIEQGREVFAVPWSIHHRNGRGCLRLLRDGAGMVESIADVLAELGPMYAAQRELFAPPALPRDALPAGRAAIQELLGDEALPVEVLAAHTGQPVATVLSALSELELAGEATRESGGYIRC